MDGSIYEHSSWYTSANVCNWPALILQRCMCVTHGFHVPRELCSSFEPSLIDKWLTLIHLTSIVYREVNIVILYVYSDVHISSKHLCHVFTCSCYHSQKNAPGEFRENFTDYQSIYPDDLQSDLYGRCLTCIRDAVE